MPRVFPGGATRRTRTADLLITKQLLYQLSYDGIFSYTISPVWAVTIGSYTPAWSLSSAGTTPLPSYLYCLA